MPTARSQPTSSRPTALVVSDGALDRHRLRRRLARGGLAARVAVDPWQAEHELARESYDVVLWATPRLELLARQVLLDGRGGAERPRAVLVLAPRASPSRVAAALGAGFDDVLRADAGTAEMVARVRAAALRRQAAAELVAQADTFRGLAEESRDLLARHAPDGTILYASRAARDILGHLPADLVGRSARDLCHPEEMDLLRHVHAGHSDGPQGAGPYLHRLRRRDGRWAWMETTTRVVRDGAGRVREVRTDSRDVTERMRADAERAALARVTAAVAGAIDLPRLLERVAQEAAALLAVPTAAVLRFHGDESLVAGAAGGHLRVGDPVPLAPRDGRTVSARIVVEGRPWGALMVRSSADAAWRPGDEERLAGFADLASLAIANADARERLMALATTDPLTGLVNHRVFHERLEGEVARAGRSDGHLSLVLIDLDHFKRVNDRHGHQVGDDVLREVSRRLSATARRGDVAARVGGEELAWLLPEAGLAAAMAAADRLRRAVGDTPFGVAGRLTASLGVSTLAPGDRAADLVRRADGALYRAKAGGRDACVAEEPEGADVMEARSG